MFACSFFYEERKKQFLLSRSLVCFSISNKRKNEYNDFCILLAAIAIAGSFIIVIAILFHLIARLLDYSRSSNPILKGNIFYQKVIDTHETVAPAVIEVKFV